MSDDVFLNVWDSPWEQVPANNHVDKTATTPKTSSIGADDAHNTGHDDDEITISSLEDVSMKITQVDDAFPVTLKDDSFTETEAEADSVLETANIKPELEKDLDLKKDEEKEVEQEQSQKQVAKESDQASSIHSTDDDQSDNVDQPQKEDEPDASVVDNQTTDISNPAIANTPAMAPDTNDDDEEEANYDKDADNDATNDATNDADNDTAKTKDSVSVKDNVADLDADSDADNDDFGDFETESEPLPPKPKGPEYKVPVKTLLASIITDPIATDTINPKLAMNPGSSSPVVAAAAASPFSTTTTTTNTGKSQFMEPLTPLTPILPSAATMAGGFKSTPPLHATPFPLKPTIAVYDSPTISFASFGGNSGSCMEAAAAVVDDDDDDEEEDDWGDFVSESSPTPEPAAAGLANGRITPTPHAPVLPTSATFLPARTTPPPPLPPVKLSLGPLQPTMQSKTTQDNEKVNEIVATLPNLSFMLDGE
ncbi:hypothetical protein D0Z00_002251 [Geotrichum galactomycetum]|uniref:Uncharacterized protein n=1 Tax=Geotrichum galactomycetum TaxID=27317 RepID=A0ACB6V4R6_9ASCO|nr:hypothetical protein D0Z00_002251 [Geotrichum candidum]